MTIRLILFGIFIFILTSCKNKTDDISSEFKQAIMDSNLKRIESIVESNPKLLNASTSELNPIEYAIVNEYYDSFNKLIQLGADVNYIGSDKTSLLLRAIRYYKNDENAWIIKLRFMKKLLNNGTNPNYTIKEGFTNKNGGYIVPTSPICKASTISLDMVKLLIDYNVNYRDPVGGVTPFGFAIKSRNFDVINYYIDTLKVDLNSPVAEINVKSISKIKTYYVNDYIKKYLNFTKDSPSDVKTKILVRKIDSIQKRF